MNKFWNTPCLKANTLCLTLALLSLVACKKNTPESEGKSEGAPPQMPPAMVRVAPPALEIYKEKAPGIGTAKANQSIMLTASVSEKVVQIPVKDSQFVDEGDLIIKLESNAEEASLNEAMVALEQEKRELNRVKELVQKDAATSSSLDNRQSAFETAKARLAAAQARLNERQIRAPFSGKLGLINVDVGTLINPGSFITTLDDISTLEVDFTLPEKYLSKLSTGLTVYAYSSAYPTHQFSGEITAIDSRIDLQTRTISLKAKLNNNEGWLLPGMFLRIETLFSEQEVYTVPEAALIQQGPMTMVMLAGENGTAVPRPVQIGDRFDGKVIIASGLAGNENVIIEGTVKVFPGAPIMILTNAPTAVSN